MLKVENAVLVVVDVQGKLATLMHEKETLFKNIVKMIKGAQVLEIPIIWNEQLPDKLGPTIPEIKKLLQNNQPLVKSSFSCCGNDRFMMELEKSKRRQILLAGMETHVCVYQTALELLMGGYHVYLIADAVSSRKLEDKQIAIQAMINAGAKISSVEMALFEMLQKAEGDRFKKIIEIVK